jgi:hypothetical protein
MSSPILQNCKLQLLNDHTHTNISTQLIHNSNLLVTVMFPFTKHGVFKPQREMAVCELQLWDLRLGCCIVSIIIYPRDLDQQVSLKTSVYGVTFQNTAVL